MPKHNKNQYTLKEVYRWYKNRVDNPVDYKTHKEVLETYGDVLREYLLEGKDVKLYQGVSLVGVRKKPKRFYLDRKASKEQGKRVLKPNTHSGFFTAFLYWRRHYTNFNSTGWSFKPCRKLARGIAEVMNTPLGHTRFVQRATVTRTDEQRVNNYSKKVLKI